MEVENKPMRVFNWICYEAVCCCCYCLNVCLSVGVLACTPSNLGGLSLWVTLRFFITAPNTDPLSELIPDEMKKILTFIQRWKIAIWSYTPSDRWFCFIYFFFNFKFVLLQLKEITWLFARKIKPSGAW